VLVVVSSELLCDFRMENLEYCYNKPPNSGQQGLSGG